MSDMPHLPASLSPAATAAVVDVLIPVAVETAYSYRADGIQVTPGDLVEVPLGTRRVVGVVWAVREDAAPRDTTKLKGLTARLDVPPLPEKLRAFVDWVARWTLAPRGMVLRMCLRVPLAEEPAAPRTGLEPTGEIPKRMTPARARVLAAANGIMTRAALAEAAECSSAVIGGLVSEGVLRVVPLPQAPAFPPLDADHHSPRLSADQSHAAAVLREGVEAHRFGVTLVEGVTGSGKTEVYFEAIAEAIRQGRQTLVLLPEIALTAQFLDRFAARFGHRPAEWHSAVGAKRRRETWLGVASGAAQVVVGARSALFLPFARLGLIIVDEEHEAAYKQEDGVTYHARDMAVVRGRIEDVPVVLASATPSIETQVNAQQGRYSRLHLPTRFHARSLPAIAAIDLRRDAPPRGHWLAPPLVRAMADTLERGEQSMLFLNRRGYAPLTLCRACGHRFQCPNCSAWLVEHRFRHALVCHHCGHQQPRPTACPSCEATNGLVACGPGIERLAEEIAEVLPDARALVLSSDLQGGADRLRSDFETVTSGACDIVIGTQLVAKGHNFPLLTLVGVVDADIGLASGDPRAAERTFQLLQQVTGRAGRFEREGRALLQTWQPDHPVIRALVSGDAARFYAEETREREAAALPPFGRLASIVVSGPDHNATLAYARLLAQAAFRLPPDPGWRLAPAGGLPGSDEMILLGPAEAPLALVAGRHRFRLLLKAPRRADVQGFLRTLAAAVAPPRGGIRLGFDIDPQSFL